MRELLMEFERALRARNLSASQALMQAVGRKELIREMRRGRVPSVEWVRALCEVLDLEFHRRERRSPSAPGPRKRCRARPSAARRCGSRAFDTEASPLRFSRPTPLRRLWVRGGRRCCRRLAPPRPGPHRASGAGTAPSSTGDRAGERQARIEEQRPAEGDGGRFAGSPVARIGPRGRAQARPPAPVRRGVTGPSCASAVAPGAAGSSPRRCARRSFRRGRAAGRSTIAGSSRRVRRHSASAPA